MKSDFILKLLKLVFESGKDAYEVFQWQPLYYKGFHVSGYSRHRTYSGFKNLKHRGTIKEVSKGNFRFTKTGRIWLQKSLLKYYRSINYQWDKKWRVVIFDIPQELHNERNKFRARLKSLGFYMIQKSVFVFPYPCEKELAIYCSELKINSCINILIADNIGYVEKETRKFFSL